MFKALSAILAIMLLLFALPQSTQDLRVSAKGAAEEKADKEEVGGDEDPLADVRIVEYREHRHKTNLRKEVSRAMAYWSRNNEPGAVFKLHLEPKVKDARILAFAFAKDFSVTSEQGRENLFRADAKIGLWNSRVDPDEAGLRWIKVEKERSWGRTPSKPKSHVELEVHTQVLPRKTKRLNIEGRLLVKFSTVVKNITLPRVESFDIGDTLVDLKESGLRIELASLGKNRHSFDLFGDRAKLVSIKLVGDDKEPRDFVTEEKESDYVNFSINHYGGKALSLVAELGGGEEIRTYHIKITGYQVP